MAFFNSVDKWLEITFVVLIVYLVLINARGFSAAASSLGRVYVDAVKALQGR